MGFLPKSLFFSALSSHDNVKWLSDYITQSFETMILQKTCQLRYWFVQKT